MNTMSEERMKEMEENKKILRDKNIDAVAQLLLDTRDHNHKTQQEMIDLRQMVTQANLSISELRGEVAALKAMGFRGTMGTGSTVHDKNE